LERYRIQNGSCYIAKKDSSDAMMTMCKQCNHLRAHLQNTAAHAQLERIGSRGFLVLKQSVVAEQYKCRNCGARWESMRGRETGHPTWHAL
jgi:hypothetical protein